MRKLGERLVVMSRQLSRQLDAAYEEHVVLCEDAKTLIQEGAPEREWRPAVQRACAALDRITYLERKAGLQSSDRIR